jgi:hypothetical protein
MCSSLKGHMNWGIHDLEKLIDKENGPKTFMKYDWSLDQVRKV